MLRTNDKNVKKEACEVFKYILLLLVYYSDRDHNWMISKQIQQNFELFPC